MYHSVLQIHPLDFNLPHPPKYFYRGFYTVIFVLHMSIVKVQSAQRNKLVNVFAISRLYEDPYQQICTIMVGQTESNCSNPPPTLYEQGLIRLSQSKLQQAMAIYSQL